MPTLAAAPGTFSLIGKQAKLHTYDLTGSPSDLLSGHLLSVALGIYKLTGFHAKVTTYEIFGFVAEFLISGALRIELQAGAYGFAGADATLIAPKKAAGGWQVEPVAWWDLIFIIGNGSIRIETNRIAGQGTVTAPPQRRPRRQISEPKLEPVASKPVAQPPLPLRYILTPEWSKLDQGRNQQAALETLLMLGVL